MVLLIPKSTLGLFYANGKGVTQDFVLAYMWLDIASSQGKKFALKNRDILKEMMTPQQIEKAQEMVRNWKAKTK